MTSYLKTLSCTWCGRHHAADQLNTVCLDDGRPLQMVMDLGRLARDYPGMSWLEADRMDMWRYGPLIGALPASGIPSAGWTRLVPVPTDLPLTVLAKDEGGRYSGFGWNETGSFKDRGIAVVVSMARHFGLSRLCLPTQGNAGDSLARFGAALGMEITVALPRSTPLPIQQSLESIASDRVSVLYCDGTIREAADLLRREVAGSNWFSAATFSEPGWRIEGKKTLGLEIAEQLGWSFPDCIVYPTGGGTGIVGMWKAFAELLELGVVTGKAPRMVSVQAEATAPLFQAMETGADDSEPHPAGTTAAVGLNVPYGIGHAAVLQILRASGGAAARVSEESIAGVAGEGAVAWCPEGAACMAALPGLMARGVLQEGDRVVVVNTCAPSKYR